MISGYSTAKLNSSANYSQIINHDIT